MKVEIEFYVILNSFQEKMEEACFFPDEWLLDICKYFSVRTACTMKLVSRRWWELLKDHSIVEQFRINKISIHPQHGACIRNGDLYMWGQNIFYRLLDHQAMCCKKLNVHGEKIHKILLSTDFTLVLTENKQLIVWGYVRRSTTLSTPTLFSDKRFVDVYLHDGCISAVSENGKFYHWDNHVPEMIDIAIPEERIAKCFNTLNIFGFTTHKGIAYVANRGYRIPLPSDVGGFMRVEWKGFNLKTVLCWYQGRYAIVLTTEGTLYKVRIGIDGEIVSTLETIRDRISKAIYRNTNEINSLYYLTWEGCVYRKRISSTKETMISFGKVFVDFSVTFFGDSGKGEHRIDMIDAKGEIEQTYIDLNG